MLMAILISAISIVALVSFLAWSMTSNNDVSGSEGVVNGKIRI